MVLRESMRAGRPKTILLGCGGFVVLSVYIMMGALKPLDSILTIPPQLIFILIVILCAPIFAILIWFGKSWPRWCLVGWVVIPWIPNILLEGATVISYISSWLIWLQLCSLGLFFTPSSNKWFRENRSAAT